MKKFVVYVNQHRFMIEGGAADEAVYQAAAAELTSTIDQLRKRHGFPDSARATTLAALLATAADKKPGGDAGPARKDDRISLLVRQIEETLDRTAISPAKTLTQ